MAKLKKYNGHFCESDYEYAFISFLEKEGWQYLAGDKMKRVYARDVLNTEDFEKFLSDTNPDLTTDEIRQISDRVRLVGAESDFATLHKVYNWLVDGIQFTPQNGQPRMISLIDFEEPANNLFKVVNQLTVDYTDNGQLHNRRPDVLLYINGIPVCIIELKNPTDEKATIAKAWKQINIRYWRDIPNLLHYCPLACISDGVQTRLGTVRTPYEHFYAWRRVDDGDKISTLPFEETETMIKGVYSPERFKYHPRIAKVLLEKEKVQLIEAYYQKCADEGASQEDIEASKKAISSLEIILGDSERLERLAVDIHDHYVSACANEPDRVQKAMIVCSKRDIAYDLLKKFKEKYPEWFIERKIPEGMTATPEEMEVLKEMPFIALVASTQINFQNLTGYDIIKI